MDPLYEKYFFDIFGAGRGRLWVFLGRHQDLEIFNDIFLDTKDLHKHFSRQNHYGPVLFRFELELLLDEEIEVWVTKNNPIYWDTIRLILI